MNYPRRQIHTVAVTSDAMHSEHRNFVKKIGSMTTKAATDRHKRNGFTESINCIEEFENFDRVSSGKSADVIN